LPRSEVDGQSETQEGVKFFKVGIDESHDLRQEAMEADVFIHRFAEDDFGLFLRV
jgi:hypothetical protein